MHLNPFAISGLLIAITCFGLIIILLKYGTTKVHRLWILFNLAVEIWGLGVFLVGISKSKEAALFGWRIGLSGGILIPAFFFHVVNVFCEQTNKKGLIFAYLQGIIFVSVLLFPQTSQFLSRYDYLFNSFYYIRASSPLFNLLTILWFLFVIWGHYKLFKFYKIANELKRKQIVYFFFGMFTGFAGGSMNFLPFHYIDIYPYGNFLIPLYCIIVTYAILKYHLMDINIAIKKGLIYSVLVAVITAVYLIFVIAIGRIFQGLVGYQSFIINLLAIFAIALLFNPLRNRIQRFLDKRFFKGTLESLAQEQQRLKEELFRTEKLAYIGGLASSVVHEIRNPLTAIKTFTEYLPQKLTEPDFQEKFQKILPQEIKRIENVVEQLLDLAKPREPTFKPINIINTIDSTLCLLENSLKLKHINVKKDYPDNEIIIQGDDEQLKQVFLNLFLNSLQAMNDGGVLIVNVSIRGNSRSEKFAEISVKDNGSGISPENLNKLFTPFFTTKKEGVGLGLTITQEIIRQHKGDIKVESKVNEGTKFVIELPLQ